MNELLTIELYFRTILNDEPLTANADRTFISEENFNKYKTNIINYSSIYSLIKLFHLDTKIDLERYLFLGSYNDTIVSIPTIDIKYLEDHISFYQDLINALKEDNFTFDDEGNIYVSSNSIETIIPPEWLFYLAQQYRHEKYNKIYFYNKNPNSYIRDEESLEKYLHTSKTFLVTLENNDNVDEIFTSTKNKTDNEIESDTIVKVDDVISSFLTNIDSSLNPEITKFIIPSTSTLIRKANSMGEKFYKLPLRKQQEYLSTWLIEYLKVNDLSLLESQKLLAIEEKDLDMVNLSEAIPGLFILYINLLTNNEPLSFISLKDFKITSYLSPKEISLRKELDSLLKQQNKKNYRSEEELSLELDTLKNEISLIDATKSTSLLAEKQEEYFRKLQEYEELISTKQPELTTKRNIIQHSINEEQSTSILDISFDYDLIISLIKKATTNGRIYINPLDKKKLIIEIYNQELGTISFRCEIKLTKLLEFVVNTNTMIEEEKYTY